MKKPKTRVCRVCGRRKPLDSTQFKKHAHKQWNLDTICRPCHRESVRRWAIDNPEKGRASDRRYRLAHPEKNAAKSARYRAAKHAAADPTADLAAIRSVYEDAYYAGEFMAVPFAVDHVVPLCRGGLHRPSNLRHIPAALNAIKGGKLDHEVTNDGFIEWLKQLTSGGTFEQVVWVVFKPKRTRSPTLPKRKLRPRLGRTKKRY